MRRGQIEMIGLMVIVLILIIVALFFLRFSLRSDSFEDDTLLSLKANNLVNAIKKVTDCGKPFEEAIIACCQEENFCGNPSCEHVTDTINSITSNMEEKVSFSATLNGESCGFIIQECQKGVTSTVNILNADAGQVEIKTVLCRK